MLFSQSAEDVQSAVREHIVPKEKVLWIGNGVDPRLFGLPPREDLRVELGLAPENKVVGFIGRLVREKGVEELFEVMGKVVQEMPTAKLLVVGDTLGSDRDCRVIGRLKKLINYERLQNAVLFAGFREDIAELLAVMDVFVLPSHREGMPRTVLEAMAARKPVIATDIRGCREEVVHGVTGLLVPVGDSDELAKAILKLLGNDELARRMGEAGRKRVETEFDEKLALERQSKVYDQLVEQRL
jgi:glycosyltransferase involved in cell wall biosynthesis